MLLAIVVLKQDSIFIYVSECDVCLIIWEKLWGHSWLFGFWLGPPCTLYSTSSLQQCSADYACPKLYTGSSGRTRQIINLPLNPEDTLITAFYFYLVIFLIYLFFTLRVVCHAVGVTHALLQAALQFSRIAAQNLIPLRGFSQVHPHRSCFSSPGHHILIIINYRGYWYRGEEKTKVATQPLSTAHAPAACVHSGALLLIWSINFPQAMCNAAAKAWTCTKMYLGIKLIDILQDTCRAKSNLSQIFVWIPTILHAEEPEWIVNC